MGEDAHGSSTQEPELVETMPWGVKERLTHEKVALGFYISGHLFDEVEREVRQFVKQRVENLMDSREPQLLAGIVSDMRVINGQRGKLAIFKLDDKSAVIEATADEATINTYRNTLKDDELVIVMGKATPVAVLANTCACWSTAVPLILPVCCVTIPPRSSPQNKVSWCAAWVYACGCCARALRQRYNLATTPNFSPAMRHWPAGWLRPTRAKPKSFTSDTYVDHSNSDDPDPHRGDTADRGFVLFAHGQGRPKPMGHGDVCGVCVDRLARWLLGA